MNDLTNLELLRLATELAYCDYNNRRANLHNQWLADNEKMKKLYGTSVPYPIIPPYPTEKEIVNKAQKLIEFLSMSRPDIEKNKTNLEFKEIVTEIAEKKEVSKIENTEKINPLNNDTIENSIEVNYKDIDIVEEKIIATNNTPEEEANIKKSSVIDKIKNFWR